MKRDLLAMIYWKLQKLPPVDRKSILLETLTEPCRRALEKRIVDLKRNGNSADSKEENADSGAARSDRGPVGEDTSDSSTDAALEDVHDEGGIGPALTLCDMEEERKLCEDGLFCSESPGDKPDEIQFT